VTGQRISSGKAWLRGLRFAQLPVISVMLLCCAEPPGKTIPPLDPSKAPAAEKKAPVVPMKPGGVTRMPLGDLYQLVQSNAALVYDVRPALYYKLGHVPGAISWPKTNFATGLAQNEPLIRAANSADTPVVIYCTDLACPDAVTVATALAERGHSVSVLQGGYEAWKIAND